MNGKGRIKSKWIVTEQFIDNATEAGHGRKVYKIGDEVPDFLVKEDRVKPFIKEQLEREKPAEKPTSDSDNDDE